MLASGEKQYYIKDHLGSIRAIMDDRGNIVESHDYYPFGLEMPMRSYVSGGRTKELFTGKERDTETNWDYFGVRYYDVSIGRWLSVDPITVEFPDVSCYQYAHNNPINRYDSDGKADFDTADKLTEAANKVMKIPKLQPVDLDGDGEYNGKGKTFCNFGVRDILQAGNDHSLDNLTASGMSKYLSDKKNATQLTSFEDVVKYAKEGITVIIAGGGHVAVVAPVDMDVVSGNWGVIKVPYIFNIGKENKLWSANKAWHDKQKAFILNKDKESADARIASRNYSQYSYQSMQNMLNAVVNAIWGYALSPFERWQQMQSRR